MGAFADALVNSGMRQAQALVIERGMGGVPPIPGTLEFKEALIRVGVDHHSATLLSNGLLAASVPGDGVLPVVSNRWIMVPDGRLTTVANHATGSTDRAAWVCRSRPYKVRLHFANATAGTMTIDSVKVACSASLDSTLAPASPAEWVANNTDVVVAAAIATDNRPTFGASAWIDVSAAEMAGNPGLYYITASALLPVAQTSSSKQWGAVAWRETQDPASGLWWAARSQNGDAHTDPTLFTSTAAIARSVIHGIEAICEDGSIVVMSNGDSVAAGSGSAVTNYGENDIWRAIRTLNLEGQKISFVNNTWGGQGSASYTARIPDALTQFKPDVLWVAAGTRNDAEPTASAVTTMQRRLADAMRAANDAGCKRVILRGQPPDDLLVWPLESDARRRAHNAWCAGRQRVPYVVYAAGPADCGDGNTAAQERFAPGLTTDGTHPDDDGIAVASPSSLAALRLTLGA